VDKIKIAFYVASTVLSILFAVNMLREQDRINHRLDVRDAYFNKGLIDGAKERETAFIQQKDFAARILAHCKQEKNGCNLPPELTILPTTKQFDSLEAILTRTKE